jgi:hypothetical protein
MPDLVTNKCYYCSGIRATHFYQIENGICIKDKCNGKIVFGTKQCVKNCGTLSDVSFTTVSSTSTNIILYGIDGTDYCYTYEDCNKGNKEINNNKCDCKFLFSLITDSNNRRYKQLMEMKFIVVLKILILTATQKNVEFVLLEAKKKLYREVDNQISQDAPKNVLLVKL